jgi:hypothetical protein
MRILKKIGISLLGLLLVIIIAATIALWYVFTPEKLTPIVNKQANKYLSCQTNIEKVEPGFFRSFPIFRLELSNISLIGDSTLSNPDTLLSSDRCFVSFDLMDYLFNDNITLTSLLIENGYLNFKIDARQVILIWIFLLIPILQKQIQQHSLLEKLISVMWNLRISMLNIPMNQH